MRRLLRTAIAVIEPPLKCYASLLDFLGRLVLWLFHKPLYWLHGKLDESLLEHPSFWGNLWRLFHQSDWQQSSRFNARVWVTGFWFFMLISEEIGHIWTVNLAVSLAIDAGVYLYHKDRVWGHRQVSVQRSYTRWVSFTIPWFVFNQGMALLLLDVLGVERAAVKVGMGILGVIVNPWIFRYRDQVAIVDQAPPDVMGELAEAVSWRSRFLAWTRLGEPRTATA